MDSNADRTLYQSLGPSCATVSCDSAHSCICSGDSNVVIHDDNNDDDDFVKTLIPAKRGKPVTKPGGYGCG